MTRVERAEQSGGASGSSLGDRGRGRGPQRPPVSSISHRTVHQPSEVIDRHRLVGFSFNGRAVTGFAGDTIVSALMANGVRAYAQGRRLQRRRGVLSADRFDPSCLLQVDDEPNVPAAHRHVASRQQVRSQHVWPSLRFDLKSLNQRIGRLLQSEAALRPATGTGFLRPAYRWLAARGDVGGRLIGAGGAELRAGYEHPDVLVVGGGLAGLAAAEAAAAAGARTLVVEADHRPGGWARLGREGGIGEVAARVDALDGVEVRTDSVAVGIDRDGIALVVTDLPGGGEQLSVVCAGHVVLATGLIERTLTFTGNDLPGVMLATGARRLVNLWAVRPGRRAVVLTANAHGDAAVADLERVGVEVAEVVDARRGARIGRVRGSAELEEVVAPGGRTVPADLLVVAAGWTIDAGLVEGAGGRVVHDRSAGRPLAVGRPGAVGVVGALAGEASFEEVVAHASVIGRQAAASALRRRRAARSVRVEAASAASTLAAPATAAAAEVPEWWSPVGRAAPPQPPLGGPLNDASVDATSVGVVDFAEDVTAVELFDPDPVTATRLLTRAAAAPASSARARAELAGLAQRQPTVSDLAERLLLGTGGGAGHLTGGVRLGSLARLVHRPVRRTALFEEHARLRARLELVDGWLEVADYGRPQAERWAVRDALGVRDTGRSGLFDLQGPDAARLVAELCGGSDPPEPGRVRRLPSGPDRSAVVVARLAEHHLQVRAEPDDAVAVEGRLLTLLHITHRGSEAYLASVGESETGIALVGPAVGSALPPDAAPVGTIGELPVELGARGRLWRWEEQGPDGSREVAELRIPAGEAGPVWRRLVDRASAAGGCPVGRLAAGEVPDDRTGSRHDERSR